MYIVTTAFPDGTKITLLDITDYDPENPIDDPDPSFYYYTVGEEYTADEGYDAFEQDDSRVVDSDTGAELTFDVMYAVENTQMDENGNVTADAKTTDSQEITVTVPSGLDSGAYRINFNLDYQTYPFNIIVN